MAAIKNPGYYPGWLALPARFERATFRLGGGCSIQLSYGDTMLVPPGRFELPSDAYKATVLTLELWGNVWWSISDLNTGPHPYKGCALTG